MVNAKFSFMSWPLESYKSYYCKRLPFLEVISKLKKNCKFVMLIDGFHIAFEFCEIYDLADLLTLHFSCHHAA